MRAFPLNTFAFLAVAVLTTSCLHAAPIDNEKMLGLAAALTKLTASVDSAVLNKGVDPSFEDQALLDFSTAHDPSLLRPFDGFVLKARQSGQDSSVLVCDQNGQIALIEDTACTPFPDQKIWQTTPNQPCDYVLDLAKVCAIP
jgi:hypothetical protein